MQPDARGEIGPRTRPRGHTDRMSLDPEALASSFGLGTPTGPLHPLPGLSPAEVWALSTSRGEWIVKRTTTINPDGERLERAARAAGVRTATPVPAPADEAGIRVWERIEATRPTEPADPVLAAWLGETVAVIAGLRLDETSTVDGLTVLCHRDINTRNVVIGPDGPVLLDFGNTGPQVPWWELVHHAFLLSCRDLGPQEPDPATIRTAVRSYVERGGVVGPADRSAFTALMAGMREWGRVHPDLAAPRLPLIEAALDRWSTYLDVAS